MAEVDVEEVLGGLDIARPHINGFENAAIDGEQVRGEAEFRFVETGDHQDFGDMAMIEHRIDGEIVGDLAKAGFEAGFAPGAAHAGLGVADDSGGSIGHAAGDQRLDGEIRGGGITAGVGDQARAGECAGGRIPGAHRPPLESKCGRGVLLLVPARICGGVAQAKGAAEIDDLGAGVEHGGREFHGDFGRRGEEHDGQAFGADGIGSARRAARLRMVDGRGAASLILPVFEKDGFSLGMGGEEADEFGAAIAAEADDACLIFIHHSE